MSGTGLNPAKLTLFELRHSLALVTLMEGLADSHPDAEMVTERELRAQRYREEARVEGRTPDGLLRFPAGALIAIEADIAPKRQRNVEQIVRAYERGDVRYHRIWWYVPDGGGAVMRYRGILEKLRVEERFVVQAWTPET